jgi:hypothetical protein
MGIFGSLFGSKSPASGQSTVQAQLPEVEAVLGRFIVDFHDRTNLHYVLIFPIMHKVAVKLFVEDFGVQSALKQYEDLVASLASHTTIRESQFKSFGWPDVSPQDVPHTNELDAQLWKLARDLIARGILKEAIAGALVFTALRAASKGLDPLGPLVSAGFLITALKELRAGVHTPPPEVRPEVTEGTDEEIKILQGLRRAVPGETVRRLDLYVHLPDAQSPRRRSRLPGVHAGGPGWCPALRP